ncbi:MAG: FprA family A-type flavoprotein [Candidatus Omnitrophica bacterium]|nr:FprA family A-type flavoprotein [Candidatus Omnitrophota bacterium]
MKKAIEIKKGIYWVGAVDWDLRNFHGYRTQRGSTYNAYLIIDEEITLVDTVKHYFYGEMLERIKSIIDPADIKYIISNHVEMDHSGSLPEILELCHGAVVVTSPNGEKGLRQHYYGLDWTFKTVNTGDVLSIGNHDISFVLTQMVHWPDSMVSYIEKEKLLLSNDAFGQHIASDERFDDEIDIDIIKNEAAKYYANIVLPYGVSVQKALKAVSSLDVEMIAPSHGIIWRKHIDDIVTLYKKWSENQVETKAVIVYDTMWGSTKKIAELINDVFNGKKITTKLFNLRDIHISDIMTEVLDAKYICVGSPTLNNGIMPTVSAFLTYLKGLSPKGRIGLAFGSYGWGGQSIGQIYEVLKSCGCDMLEAISFQYVPDNEILRAIEEKVKDDIVASDYGQN